MSVIQVTIPTPLLLVAVMAVVALVSVVAIARFLDLLFHIVRYRHHRRMYPAAERGRVWRHVRG